MSLKILLIDTCGQDGSIALAEAGRPEVIVGRGALAGRSASELLMPEVGRMLGEAGWELGEIEVVGVVSGPGSFTGVRVGVAAAKGLCEARGARMVAVSRLEVLARKGGTSQALLDAGRGEFFYGGYAAGEIAVEALLTSEEVVRTVRGARAAVCEEAVRTAFGEMQLTMVEAPEAADALRLVLARVVRSAFNDVADVDARYLRKTELEVLERLRLRAEQP